MRQYRESFRVFLALVGGPRGILSPKCAIFILLGQMRRKYVRVGFRSKLIQGYALISSLDFFMYIPGSKEDLNVIRSA